MNVIRMTLIVGDGPAILLLYFDGPSASGSGPAIATMTIEAGQGVKYVRKHFPNISLEVIHPFYHELADHLRKMSNPKDRLDYLNHSLKTGRELVQFADYLGIKTPNENLAEEILLQV